MPETSDEYAQAIQVIKDARARLGLSQQALATAMGVSIDTVKEIEQGHRPRVKYETHQKLCEALGLDGLALTVYEG